MYELLVIGSGPAGLKAAIAGAKMGKHVAIVERRHRNIGGVCLHTGTIPSKTMREAIMHLTGYLQRDVYGEFYHRKHSITMPDLLRKLARVTQNEVDVIQEHLDHNGIEVLEGEASFYSPTEVKIRQDTGSLIVEAEKIIIACGTRPARPPHIPFDSKRIFDSDEILKLDHIPRNMIVVGGGVVGIEYAIMFAVLGVNVTVIDGREQLLGFCDREIVDSLLYQCRSLGMMFRLGETVTNVAHLNESRVVVDLESGKRLAADTVLFSVGRVGDTERLNLEAAGLGCDERGRIKDVHDLKTEVPNIFAVGDIVGFPSLASTSMEQGRRAVHEAFGIEFKPWDHLPYGLYTIPEIAMIGQTEQQLTQQSVPYEVGKAQFSETARGQISGDLNGLLKIIFHRETKEILGVHCIGDNATELIHIGQAVMAHNGTVEYFRDAVFNYPTYAECYKIAAFDGLNRAALGQISQQEIVEV